MGHVRVHIINWPISDEPIKSWGIKTEHMLRAVVQLVNIFNYFAMIGCSNMNERLHDMTQHWMLIDFSASSKKRYNKHVILIKLVIDRPNIWMVSYRLMSWIDLTIGMLSYHLK